MEVHRYGPHIFHTDNERVWQFVNRFARFNQYRHRGVVRSGDRLFSFPINLLTLQQLWGVATPEEAQLRLASKREPIDKPRNLEEWALSQARPRTVRDVHPRLHVQAVGTRPPRAAGSDFAPHPHPLDLGRQLF